MSMDQVVDIVVEPSLENQDHFPEVLDCPTSKTDSNFLFSPSFSWVENVICLVRLCYI